MSNSIDEILEKDEFSREDIITLLKANKEETVYIYKKAAQIKEHYVGKKVYFRGLVEYSNICRKNCFYCGIRASNKHYQRYTLTDEEVLSAAQYAYQNRYGSMVLQSGERSDKAFIDRITNLIKQIKELSKEQLGLTLSLGEQTEETYRQWFDAGAHRYLLRIEVSNRELYGKLHPDDKLHDYDARIGALQTLKKIGYQTGTGVMIGLPFQTVENLTDDLLFFKKMDIDMCGMGPYIEHEHTPLYKYRDILLPKLERFKLSMKMVALLRIMMKDVNIAATTAMQTLDPQGREKALMVGANIIMPNLTPVKYRGNYLLYEDKPCIDEEASECKNCLEVRIHMAGDKIGYGEWGDSKHFASRTSKAN